MPAGVSQPGERDGHPQLTREGYAQLAERVVDIREHRLPQMRPLLIESERDERIVAEFERLMEEADMLDMLLGRAQVIALEPSATSEGVLLGMRVQVVLEDDSRAWVRPVHPEEAFLDEERISATSPLARALMGASPGDVVMVQAPSGAWPCTVLAVDLDGVGAGS